MIEFITGGRDMKKCFKCGLLKDLHDFYKHKMMADGHLNKCKDCAKKDVRKHRMENDSVREYDRNRSKYPHRAKHLRENAKKWREQNPEGNKAHNAVNNAVRDGRLIKGACEVCGEKRTHAHHDDYSKPLSVKWLCAMHHHRIHAGSKI